MNFHPYLRVEQQNEQNYGSSNFLASNGLISSFQSYFSKVEFHSYFVFYLLQMLEMLFTTVLSTLTFLLSENSDSIPKYITNFISVCCISQSIFNNKSSTYFVIGSILLLVFLSIVYSIYLVLIIKKGNEPLDSNFLKPWIILQRLLLPLPGYIIGCYMGYYLVELTKKIYLGQLFLIIFAMIFWSWSVVSSSFLYNSYQIKRKNDNCQIRHNYFLIDCFITGFPMIQAMIPYVISIFISSSAKSIIYVSITSLISIFIIFFAMLNHVYYDDSMNQYITYLYLIKIPLSFIWVIKQFFPMKLEKYLIFCLAFMIAAFAFMKFISKYFSCNHRASLSQIRLNTSQTDTKIEDQDQAIPLNIQLTDDQISQSSFFDPFISWPYPFSLISLTRQDIILSIYLAIGVLTMVLVNGLAAQRIPIANPLPDIIQEHFYVADYLRKNSDSFQISNILVLIQIFLLIVSVLTVPQYLNVRRFVLIYSTLCLVRSISFLLTSLPAPCAGAPNCPCADPEIINQFKKGNPIKISLTWLFGLGMFLKLPQCGDLIISGHTMWLWLASRTICSVIEYALPRPFNWLAITLLITFTLITMCYIILSKNHYSIDVWFAFLLTELFFTLYNSLSENAIQPQRPTWSLAQKIIKFFETRPPKRILAQTKMMMQYNE